MERNGGCWYNKDSDVSLLDEKWQRKLESEGEESCTSEIQS